jgi:SNF2 family DNA or RNA helicase
MYEPKWPCHPHQLIGERKMRGRRAFALLMAMRTGKTKTAIDDFGEMESAGEVRDLLVLAPAGVYRTWHDEFDKHAGADLLDRARIHTWETGGGAGHARAATRFMAERDDRVPRIMLMNIEALSYKTAGARELAAEFVGHRHAEVIVDESTTIKSHATNRTKFVIRALRDAGSYRRILCGLPTPQSPLDLFGQFTFLDENILGYAFTEFTLFRARYAKVVMTQLPGRKFLVPLIRGFQNTDELYAKIEPHSYRIRLEDVKDLPVTYQVRHVELTPEQKKAYDSLKKNAIAELEGGRLVTAQLVIVQMLRLHQILCGFVKDSEGVVRELPEKRTAALLDLFEEYDGKAIVWCSYDLSIRRVAAALKDKYGEGSVALFWGGNIREREGEDKRFKEDPKCRFMVATPGAGGRGWRWDVANLVVYYSSTNNLEHRDQSEERAKDMTKTDSTAYVDLIVPGSIDEKFIHALRRKIDLASVITGDAYREWLV